MGIVRDVTVDQLTQAVGNIDTSTLAQDSTLQDVVTAIGNISGGSDPVTNTTVNTLGKDTTLQSIAAAINSLSGAISPVASNVTFDNTGTGLSASNVQAAIAEVNNNYKDNTCSIERASGVSSSVPLPTIMRRGKVVIVDFSFQIPAGSYGTAVWVVSPVPINNMHSIVYYSNSPTRLTLYTSGTLGFTAPITPTSSGYINGQLIYLTDD